ncbi:MAG: hypothetical protein ACR2LQ_07600 [Acidimicrobiales bacterium]
MLICCWSCKGGAGTTVVASALALSLARVNPPGALIVDLAGDVPAVLGLSERPDDPGVAGWLGAAESAGADELARLEVPVGRGLRLLSRGDGALLASRGELLGAVLAADPRPIVVDAGVLALAGRAPGLGGEVAITLAGAASRSLLVVRPCFLAVRRALRAPVRASGIVVVVEEGRALAAVDVEETLGIPVLAQVKVTPQVARAVDAGILATRLPRSLERDLSHAA